MLDGSRSTTLPKEDPGRADHAVPDAVGPAHCKLALLLAEIDRANVRFLEVHKDIITLIILAPDPQLFKDLIILIYPAVPVGIIFTEVGKAVPGLRSEKLVAVIDLSIIILVKGEEARALPEHRDLVRLPVAVDIKPEGLVLYIKDILPHIHDQRIEKRVVHGREGDIHVLRIAPAHIKADVKIYRSPVLGHGAARCRKCHLLALLVGYEVLRISAAPKGPEG